MELHKRIIITRMSTWTTISTKMSNHHQATTINSSTISDDPMFVSLSGGHRSLRFFVGAENTPQSNKPCVVMSQRDIHDYIYIYIYIYMCVCVCVCVCVGAREFVCVCVYVKERQD